jgi:hypothetical protein
MPPSKQEERKMDCNESVMIMSAVRYMLGRSSYGVGCVCDYIKSQKNRLTESNKQVIERDILERIKDFPDISYKQDWLDLIEFIKN